MHAVRYETPYHWWGPGPAPPAPLALRDLLRNGTIDVECASTLWAGLAQRQSLTVIGGPSGLGKSTLLHAVLPALPEPTQRLYLRGCFETFAFQDDLRCVPSNSALLVNEISPHLPIYLWGPAVQRTLEARDAGYQILATAHGRSFLEFAASLTGSPLRVPARLLAAFGLVALLEPAPGATGRRVTELWQLSPSRDGVSLDRLSPGGLPAGVSTDQMDAARLAIQPFVSNENTALVTELRESDPSEKQHPALLLTPTGLEQTPAGE
jgi:energy-coupling factor transporter ATP-binding protein EcfA2